ncbi:hypothetical protein VNO77_34108 [Canavalia gladiata]|uniref:Uncharacterized protein n=1 Tax=Canavalia gladiata TaxID=3824 RepID=A0AAN9KDP7_CANGL
MFPLVFASPFHHPQGWDLICIHSLHHLHLAAFVSSSCNQDGPLFTKNELLLRPIKSTDLSVLMCFPDLLTHSLLIIDSKYTIVAPFGFHLLSFSLILKFLAPLHLGQASAFLGKSDQISSCSFTTHKGQAPGFSSEHSNVVAGLQHNGNPNSLVVCPGLVTWDQHNKDKLKIGSSSAGNMNGCTEDSCLSNGNIELVSDTSNTPSPALGTPSHRKKVVVYSRKTNVEIEDGGTLMPMSDDMWVAYTFPLK